MTAGNAPGISPAQTNLDELLSGHRTELTGFCYRMLGAGSEAEDAVQETLVRAWKSRDGFEGRSAVRSWLFKIAHNVCVDMLRSPQRRARPMDLGPSTPVNEAALGPPRTEDTFVQPIADERVIDLAGDPADVAIARDSIRLAFLAALQYLPAQQRAALILCEVLRWKAAEVAELLELSVAAVNSSLQRARTTMADVRGEALDSTVASGHQTLVDQYIAAFEAYDMERLAHLLRDDVVLSMPPFDLWMVGPENLVGWFLGEGSVCRDGKLVPVNVNGTAGFGNYHRVADGVWEPFAIQVIEVAGGKIAGHHNFLYPEMFAEFGLPGRIESASATAPASAAE